MNVTRKIFDIKDHTIALPSIELALPLNKDLDFKWLYLVNYYLLNNHKNANLDMSKQHKKM